MRISRYVVFKIKRFQHYPWLIHKLVNNYLWVVAPEQFPSSVVPRTISLTRQCILHGSADYSALPMFYILLTFFCVRLVVGTSKRRIKLVCDHWAGYFHSIICLLCLKFVRNVNDKMSTIFLRRYLKLFGIFYKDLKKYVLIIIMLIIYNILKYIGLWWPPMMMALTVSITIMNQ